jgi:AraC-like DNA-binding protein
MGLEINVSGFYPIHPPKTLTDTPPLSPALITAYYFRPLDAWPRGMPLQERTVADYEFEYIIESDGGIQSFNGESSRVDAGDVVFRRPGELTQGTMRYECVCLIFSPSGDLPRMEHYHINQPKPIQKTHPNELLATLPHVLSAGGDPAFRSLFDRLFRSFVNPRPYAELLEQTLLLELLYRSALAATAIARSGRPTVGAGTRGDRLRERLSQAHEWMEAHYSDKITIAEIAARAGLSESHFRRAYEREYSQSPLEGLTQIRLDRAKEALTMTDKPIKAIGWECGFPGERHFYARFTQLTGMTPGEFRNAHRFPLV